MTMSKYYIFNYIDVLHQPVPIIIIEARDTKELKSKIMKNYKVFKPLIKLICNKLYKNYNKKKIYICGDSDLDSDGDYYGDYNHKKYKIKDISDLEFKKGTTKYFITKYYDTFINSFSYTFCLEDKEFRTDYNYFVVDKCNIV